MPLALLTALTTVDSAVQNLFKAAIIEVTGKLIESAGTDTAKQLVKAQEIAALAGAAVELLSGNAAGMKDLQAALANFVSVTKDPANAMALNTLLAIIANEQEARGGLLAQAAAILPVTILGWVVSTAQAYVTLYTPATPAAPAA